MSHVHTPRASQRNRRPLAIAFGLVAVFMLVEAAAGFLTGSLALVSDAGHMATDALGLGMALAAMTAADRGAAAGGRTFGLFRLEVLAALGNAVLLFGVAGFVLFEAVSRLAEPTDVEVGPMLAVAVVGLVVNLVCWRLLRSGAEKSLNVRGAYLEVLADLLASVGVIIAALVMVFTGWPYADPLFAGLIGLLIFPRAWRLGMQAVRVLVQAAPSGMDLEQIRVDLASLPGVIDVHDLHVWTLTSEMDVATVHLMTNDDTDPHSVLDGARRLLQDRYRLDHATLQVEPSTHRGCSELSW